MGTDLDSPAAPAESTVKQVLPCSPWRAGGCAQQEAAAHRQDLAVAGEQQKGSCNRGCCALTDPTQLPHLKMEEGGTGVGNKGVKLSLGIGGA